MKLVLKDNFFDKDKHCTFENDKLGRKSITSNLTNILKHSNTEIQGLILALNAQWGNGKTTFIKMWKNMLDKDCKIPNLYFSAWEEDYTKEPLIAVLGELNRYLEYKGKENKKIKGTLKFAKKTLQKAAPTLLKISVKGFLNKIGIDNEFLQEASQALTEESAKTLIENYSKEKECLAQLKENLTKVFEATGAKEGQPFIIFIDEIDRCRPTYAIEMLENIKHLFGIPNLVFVISIDKAQLSKSIQAIYGQIDTENYLRRFFDLEFTLPNPFPQSFCSYLQEQLDIKTNLSEIFIADNFTLRELQKILPQIKLLEMQQFQGNNKEPAFYMRHAIFILLIKIYRPDLYMQIPNITDAEGIMGIVEKLVCKEKSILNESLFMKYIEIIYAISLRIFFQDSHFWGSQLDTKYKKTIDESSYNKFSYIVKTYHTFFTDTEQGRRNFPKAKVEDDYINKIITAINFTSKFAIQDKSNNHATNSTP